MNGNRALILDRDGVICEFFPGGYLTSWDRFRLTDGIVDLVGAARALDFLIVVATNQSPVGRGILQEKDLHDIHRRMELLFPLGFDGIYYCPHLSTDDCECRKPKPGMLKNAERDLQIDLRKSFFVGDSAKDMLAGSSVDCPTIFLRHSHNDHELLSCNPQYIISNPREAISILQSSF